MCRMHHLNFQHQPMTTGSVEFGFFFGGGGGGGEGGDIKLRFSEQT